MADKNSMKSAKAGEQSYSYDEMKGGKKLVLFLVIWSYVNVFSKNKKKEELKNEEKKPDPRKRNHQNQTEYTIKKKKKKNNKRKRTQHPTPKEEGTLERINKSAMS